MVCNKSYSRLTRLPRQSFFLLGVRGVGKSTWVRRQLPDALRIDLLDEARYHDYLADPSLFAAELASSPPGSRVVVDEIQRLPSLLNEVHRFIEERRLKFALLGSSARKLKAAGVNLLAGRALHRTMHPLTPAELGGDFDLDSALEWGTIPLVWVSDERREVLESYVQLYLREEIRAEALVRNLPGFARFLPIAALCHGQVVNISGLGARLRGSRARRCRATWTSWRTPCSPSGCPPSRRGYGCVSAATLSCTGSIRGSFAR